MRLSKTAIAGLSLPAGKSCLIVWDDALAGFGVKVNATNKQFIAQYRVGGKRTPTRETIGRTDRMSLDDAREIARRSLLKVGIGHDPAAEKAEARARARITFQAVSDAYLARAEGQMKPRSFAEVARHVRTHLAPFHDLALDKITRAVVAGRLNEIARERGPVAANRVRATLSAFFTYAMGEGQAEANPCVGTNKAVDEAAIARDHVIMPAELTAIWQTCRDDDHGRVVKLLALTGQRRDEVANMTWAEIDFDRALWSIPAPRTKNGRPHDVPLAAAAVALLRAVPRREGRALVFGEGAGGFSGWSACKRRMDERMAKAEPKVEVRPWRLHDLRRTAATGMAELGILPHVVEAVLNHVSGHRAGVAGIYNRATYAAEKREALDRWAAHLTGEPKAAFRSKRKTSKRVVNAARKDSDGR